MLSSSNIYAIVPTKNLAAARAFFSEKLQLEPSDEELPGGALLYKCGDTMFQLYETGFAGTNQATTMGWSVDDVDATVADLKTRGVEFEEYDFPGLKTENGIATMGDSKAAWFRGPDDVILCISSKK